MLEEINKLHEIRRTLMRGHTRNSYARNFAGDSVEPTDPTAIAWCVLGAVTKCCPQEALRRRVIGHIKATLERTFNTRMLANWQDREDIDTKDVLELIEETSRTLELHQTCVELS